MGVYCDNYLGYVMDITHLAFSDDSVACDDPVTLKLAGIVPRGRGKAGDIELVGDGMCGEYAYLVLIEFVGCSAGIDPFTEVADRLNEVLATALIPEAVTEKMTEAFRLVFGHVPVPPITLKRFAHYH